MRQNEPTLLPIMTTPVFNNWDIVAKGWYIALPSKALRNEQVTSIDLCGHRIALYRGRDSVVRALDAYCPHLGTDLGIGKVDGNLLRCAFHHWAFAEDGRCVHIPCGAVAPPKALLLNYPTVEKYGFIWVFPDSHPSAGVPDFDELAGKRLLCWPAPAFERRCHHHICMMNGIDAQHLKSIHGFDIQMELTISERPESASIDFMMRGIFPATTLRERLASLVLGRSYEYLMRYVYGCIGMLTMMKGVRVLPPLHIIFADAPIEPGRSRIQPIIVAEARSGLFGKLVSYFFIVVTYLAYLMLKDEDGTIYDNIKFHTRGIIGIDEPLVRYINYVNGLEPSRWSRIHRDKWQGVGLDNELPKLLRIEGER